MYKEERWSRFSPVLLHTRRTKKNFEADSLQFYFVHAVQRRTLQQIQSSFISYTLYKEERWSRFSRPVLFHIRCTKKNITADSVQFYFIHAVQRRTLQQIQSSFISYTLYKKNVEADFQSSFISFTLYNEERWSRFRPVLFHSRCTKKNVEADSVQFYFIQAVQEEHYSRFSPVLFHTRCTRRTLKQIMSSFISITLYKEERWSRFSPVSFHTRCTRWTLKQIQSSFISFTLYKEERSSRFSPVLFHSCCTKKNLEPDSV